MHAMQDLRPLVEASDYGL